jgi:hypothetical protein
LNFFTRSKEELEGKVIEVQNLNILLSEAKVQTLPRAGNFKTHILTSAKPVKLSKDPRVNISTAMS